MKIQKREDHTIYPDQICKVTQMNDIIEVRALAHNPTSLQSVVKLSKDLYMLKQTGEVKEYQHHENRGGNTEGLKRSLNKLRKLINNNFSGNPNELLLTLTYSENMTDKERLYEDFKKFMKRLRYVHGEVEYIVVMEPQQRGAWHGHALLRFDDKEKVYIPNDEIARLWGQGFTTTKALSKIDNIGAYLTPYLTNLELTEESAPLAFGKETYETIVECPDGTKQSKRFIKGARCALYPPGMNIYRNSRGCKAPTSEEMPYREVKKIVGTATPDYGRSVVLTDDSGKPLNIITYQHFNRKRQKKQEGTDFK